jgi:4-hydroxybenzoate polyprenyltransferase
MSNGITSKKILFLIYKRTRPAFGLTMGIIPLYGIFVADISFSLLAIALSFFFIQMFGDLYNDYHDYEDDIRNSRDDKLTVSKILNKYQIRNFSLLFLFIGLGSLFFLTINNIVIFLFGIFYIIILWLYSSPKLCLKKYNIRGYLVAAFSWLILAFVLSSMFYRVNFFQNLLFALFCFSHLMYIFCQKDSTDLKDKTNLFLEKGWRQASLITVLFAFLTSLFLLSLSIINIFFLFIWIVNAISKIINLKQIWNQKINRSLRSKLVGIEFLTPYLYVITSIFSG